VVPRKTTTRERLISNAAELFWRQGYAQTGVNEIIQAAGATSGSFYHFFPAKEDLLLAVIEHVGEASIRDAFDRAAEQTEDPVEQVFAVLDISRQHLLDNEFRLGSPLGTLAAELSESHPHVRERIADLVEGWIGRMRRLLSKAGDRLPPGVDHDSLASCILGLAEGAILQARVARSAGPFDAAVLQLRNYLDLLDDRAGRPEQVASVARSTPRPRAQPVDWRSW
jgi:AcrR family transcriptional regulator